MQLIPTLLLCAALAAAPAFAAHQGDDAEHEPFKWYQYDDAGLGADGYDVVAYFDEDYQRSVRGKPEFIAEYGGTTWQFANAEHRDMFIAAPEKYAPQYGGHCAYAASFNALAFGDPNEWTIEKGRLYFNYSLSVRKRWERESTTHIQKGDRNWPTLATKK